MVDSVQTATTSAAVAPDTAEQDFNAAVNVAKEAWRRVKPLGVPPAPADTFPTLDELDVLNMKTGEKDDKGNDYTVSSLTIKTLMEKYKKGIDDGTLKDTDPRYKFYYAMQATSDVAFGRGITPYFENGPDGGRSERWEGNDYQTTAEDMKGVYNADAVKNFFKENAKDPGVLKDWKEAQDAAVKKLPNKEELKTKLHDMLLSKNFKTYLDKLKANGETDKAVAEAQRGVTSYSTLASQKEVDDVIDQMGQKDLVDNLETILASPDKIEDQYWEAATADWAAMSLEALNRGIQIGRHGLNSLKLAETKEWFKKLVGGTSTALRQTAAVFKAFAKTGKMPDTIPQATLDAIGAKVGSAWGERTPLRSFFTNLNNAGAFSTAIGTIALTGSIYQQTHGGAFDDDHLQNMQIARGYMLFFGTTPEMAKLGSGLTKFPAIAKFLGSGDTSAIFAAKSVQDIFKVDARAQSGLIELVDMALAADASKTPKAAINKIADQIGKENDILSSALKTKFAAAAIKVMGATSFVGFGIVDGVLGGFTAKAGADQHDPTMIAQGVMQVLTGTFTTAAGIAMGLSAAGVAAAAPFISPLLLGAAVVGGAIILIDIVKALIQAFKEDDVKSMGDRAYFDQQSKFGLTQSDWSDKLEYLDLAGFGDGGNGKGVNSRRPYTPEGKSVFETYDWQEWIKEYKTKHNEIDYSDLRHPVGVDMPPYIHGGDPAGEKQGFENNLNWVVSNYYQNITIVDKKDKDGNVIEHGRTVPAMTGELADHVKELAKYYFRFIDGNAGSDTAADWIRDQIAGRIPGAYPDGEQHTQDDEKDDGVEAQTIFKNWYNKKHPGQTTGREDITAIVNQVLDEL